MVSINSVSRLIKAIRWASRSVITVRRLLTVYLASMILVIAGTAVAQDPFADFRRQMEAQRLELDRKRAESRSKLREAIIGLREARQKSCRFQNGADCVLAELSSVELLMLDVEEKYRAEEGRSQSDVLGRNYKKIQEVAAELRSKTAELAEAIDSASK